MIDVAAPRKRLDADHGSVFALFHETASSSATLSVDTAHPALLIFALNGRRRHRLVDAACADRCAEDNAYDLVSEPDRENVDREDAQRT